MSELQTNIEKLLQVLRNNRYEGVTWKNGLEPSLSALNLNKSEDALRDLLNIYNNSENGGIIQQILTFLKTEVTEREFSDTIVNNNIDKLYSITSENTTLINNNNTQINTKVENINTKVDTINTDVNNIQNSITGEKGLDSRLDQIEQETEDLSSSITTITNNINESITSIQQEITNINTQIENIPSDDNIVKNNDSVILYCGNASTNI